MKRIICWLGIATLAMAGVALAQGTEKKPKAKKAAAPVDKEAVERGRILFEKKCALCHNADSDVRKIGPGLKGLNQRGKFSVNDNKITDKTLKAWIESGDEQMPPFKEVLSEKEIMDVVRYVRTL
ncbi:MAG: c-type cytochrome [Acidobacteriia bacterium]|nr:c-type cytochrome [Terriglobia bacterium]